MFNTNLMLNNSSVPHCLCACFPLLQLSYQSPNCGASRCCPTCSEEVSWFLWFHKPLKKIFEKLSISGTNRGRCPMAWETIQRLSLAGIHGGGRDLRIVWDEVASLAPELGSPASGRWGTDSPFQQCRVRHIRVPGWRKAVGGNTCAPLWALLHAKPHGAVRGFAMHLVDAVYSQILLPSGLDLILGGLKESTLGRIVRGEDT